MPLERSYLTHNPLNAERTLSRTGSLLQALIQVPVLVQLVFVFTIVAYFGGYELYGYHLSGIAWVVPLALALPIITRSIHMVRFPVVIWMPWALFLIAHLLFVNFEALDERVSPLQRTVQLLSPLVLGMAVSTYRTNAEILEGVSRLFRYLSIILLIIVAVKTGILITGTLPEFTGLAPEMITVILLCTYFINRYLVSHEKKYFQFWAVLAIVPFIALTRTAIAVVLLTFPLALGPMKRSRRFFTLFLVIIIAVAAFYSPRVQKKMFFSGSGEISDVMTADFSTTGRSTMWMHMYEDLEDNLFAGYGTGAGETFSYKITGGLSYPHNDWLLTLYDFGIVGVCLFFLTLTISLFHAYRQIVHITDPEIKTLFLAGASAFIPFCLMMFTDNIMIYASYFGNLHFSILGLAYGALKEKNSTDPLS